MKKTIAVLLALAMALGLCACAGPAKQSSALLQASEAELIVSSSSSEPEESFSESETGQSSDSSEAEDSSEESSEESQPTLGTSFAPQSFTFRQESGGSITVELAVPDDWYGYEGDVSLFRDVDGYEDIKVLEVAYAIRLASASDIDEYISDPGFDGSEILTEKMYTGFGGSSVYYYKTKAAPMGGAYEFEVWYPCFYYVLMPDNTFVCLVLYALETDGDSEYRLFDTIADSMTIREG